MTDEIESYELRAVLTALRQANGGYYADDVETARLILKALKLAQARAEKRKIKESHRWFAEHAAKHEAYWARIEERHAALVAEGVAILSQPIHPPAEA